MWKGARQCPESDNASSYPSGPKEKPALSQQANSSKSQNCRTKSQLQFGAPYSGGLDPQGKNKIQRLSKRLLGPFVGQLGAINTVHKVEGGTGLMFHGQQLT